jgi:hypothetical protein
MPIAYFKGAKPYVEYGALDDNLKLMTIIFTDGYNLSSLRTDFSDVADKNVPPDVSRHVDYHATLDADILVNFGVTINTMNAPHGHFQGDLTGALVFLLNKKMISKVDFQRLYTFIGGT